MDMKKNFEGTPIEMNMPQGAEKALGVSFEIKDHRIPRRARARQLKRNNEIAANGGPHGHRKRSRI